MSVRDVIAVMASKHGVRYHSGTLTNFLGQAGVLRSKKDARRLAMSKATRVCELCDREHSPRSWNQRWCDDCTGRKKYARRVGAYGLPAAVFERMFSSQDGRCAICNKQFEHFLNTRDKKTLFIDHDHSTDQIRGLLCARCNNGMSYVDNERWLQAAKRYATSARDCHDPVYVRPVRARRYVRNVPIDVSKN